jgi:hypothetical protein
VPLVLAGVEQLAREREVVLHHVLAIALHGVAAGAFMEHRFDLAVMAVLAKRS